MFKFSVLDGPQVDLEQMLAAKDARIVKEREWLTVHSQTVLLHVTLRIPGSVKTGRRVVTVFSAAIQALEDQLDEAVLESQIDTLATGPEAYLAVRLSPITLKRLMVGFEKQQCFCDLLDLDVVTLKDGQLDQISRADLDLPPRACLVCGEDAKSCARSRRHGLPEVQEVVEAIIKEGWTTHG
ncbi:citrate lyase holo-[acyl-carrier protein] synthase [Lacticaseibacillus chiayiensis]|uniref:citrate lyase holo-[acyl-carrier protein] synthase n=1 Tax=Lacticaseibacillus chiayiensis TaxID=2100821 RepID=UPI003C77A4AD